MSRDIQVGVSTGEQTVGVKYSTQFRPPLVVKPCDHLIREHRGMLRNELWLVTFHGKSDGSSEISRRCMRLKGQQDR